MSARLLTIAITVLFTASAMADKADDLFQSLYGPKVDQARATPDPSDDIAIAKSMLTTIENATTQPDFLAVMCDHIYSLTHRTRDGYSTAVAAMRLLASNVPAKRSEANQKLIATLTRQMASGKTDERTDAAVGLVATLIAVGNDKVATKHYPQAAADYRRAFSLARQRKLPDVDLIKARLDQALELNESQRKLERLQAKLLRDANDHTAAEAIVIIFIRDYNDPSAAKKFINRVKDEQLKAMATLAAKDEADLNTADSLTLGEWYKSLADLDRSTSKTHLLIRARDHLRRFRTHHQAKDIQGIKADALLVQIEQSLENAGPTLLGTPSGGKEKPDKNDLLKLVDATKDAISGRWELQDGLLTHRKTEFARLALPIHISGSYQIRVEFIRTLRNNFGLILPVGGRQVAVQVGEGGLDTLDGHRINTKNETSIITNEIQNNKTHTLEVSVSVRGDKATIVATFDKKPHVNWTGSTRRLGLPGHYTLRDSKRIGFVSWRSAFSIKSAKLKLRPGGEVKRLRTQEN